MIANIRSMDMEPAKTIIEYLGGVRAVASIVGKHPSRIYRWTYPVDKREGCGGIVPLRDQQHILDFCDANGIDLVRDDFFSRDRVAAFLAARTTVAPADSIAGRAGVVPGAPESAATSFCQGREEVSRRVHTPEIAGSTPAPATSFQSPELLPTGEAGVSFSHFDTPATISAEGKR